MFILLLLITSVCLGLLLQKCRAVRYLERTATWTVWLLIFVFGIALGSNEAIVNDFAHFGLTAMAVSLAGVAGSVVAVWAVGGYMDRRGRK